MPILGHSVDINATRKKFDDFIMTILCSKMQSSHPLIILGRYTGTKIQQRSYSHGVTSGRGFNQGCDPLIVSCIDFSVMM